MGFNDEDLLPANLPIIKKFVSKARTSEKPEANEIWTSVEVEKQMKDEECY